MVASWDSGFFNKPGVFLSCCGWGPGVLWLRWDHCPEAGTHLWLSLPDPFLRGWSMGGACLDPLPWGGNTGLLGSGPPSGGTGCVWLDWRGSDTWEVQTLYVVGSDMSLWRLMEAYGMEGGLWNGGRYPSWGGRGALRDP